MTPPGSTTPANAIIEYYKRVAPIYDATRFFFLFDRNLAIDLLGLRPGDSVLEIGTGTGSNLPHICRTVGPSGHVTGLDFSPEMLAVARRRIRRQGLRNVELVRADAENYNLKRGFQAVLFSYSLSMMQRQDDALSVATSHLARDGKVGILDFGNFSRWGMLSSLLKKWLAKHGVMPIEFPRLERCLSHPKTVHRRGGYNFITVGSG
jgi:S-adenosylmethionine-diacylgycerolhomoserine-N-methlytransferase